MRHLIFRELGSRLYMTEKAREIMQLDNAVYQIGMDEQHQLFLVKIFEKFNFDYKIYDLEVEMIKRIIKTYTKTTGNLGMLFNGLKGTGKTVSAKIICNELNQPVILVDNAKLPGLEHFLNGIPQNITILVDEYEKVYAESNDLLTMMDGVFNAEKRRVFILTTNKLYIEDNLIQRPSRIRYLKEFNHLKPKVVEEIVNDILINREFKRDCIRFISNLQLITVDIVKSIINEVNIHDESPEVFADMFNVKKITGKYNLYLVEEDIASDKPLTESVRIYPRPNFTEDHVGCYFEVHNQYLGNITNVINENTIEITVYKRDSKGNWTKNVDSVMILKVENSYSFHSSYLYDEDYGLGRGLTNKPKATTNFNDMLKRINTLPEPTAETIAYLKSLIVE